MDEHDIAIGNFRAEHDAALYNKDHVQHVQRTEELGRMYEAKHAGAPAPAALPNTTTTDFRAKHSAALYDASHPEHALRTAELTRLYEAEFSGDKEAAPEAKADRDLEEIIHNPGDVDFSALKAKDIPFAEPDEDLERYSREWIASAGMNHIESEALSLAYVASFDMDVERSEIIGEGHLQHKYGDRLSDVLAGAGKLIDETFGLKDFLDRNPAFAAHPQVIDTIIRAADAKGYTKGPTP